MTHQPGKVCPHLGLADDAATHMNFPSPANRCFNCQPSGAPSLAHQQEHCISQTYDNCPLYQNSGDSSMPAAIRAVAPFSGAWRAILLTILIFAIIGWLYFFQGTAWKTWFDESFLSPISPTGNFTQTPPASSPEITASTTTSPASATVKVANTSTAPVTASLPPSETFTASPDPRSFEVTIIPLGNQNGFLVHIVEYGETLDMIANKYGTTVQAIMAVNYELTPPVWAHYPIVIPVGAKDTIGLPAFEVYVVEDETVSSESLADTLGVDIGELQLYNLCVGSCQFDKGDVLLIPR